MVSQTKDALRNRRVHFTSHQNSTHTAPVIHGCSTHIIIGTRAHVTNRKTMYVEKGKTSYNLKPIEYMLSSTSTSPSSFSSLTSMEAKP